MQQRSLLANVDIVSMIFLYPLLTKKIHYIEKQNLLLNSILTKSMEPSARPESKFSFVSFTICVTIGEVPDRSVLQ